jgi:predicted nucleotidyltransferase
MKLHESIEPFREAVEALQHLFSRFNDRGVIIGGVAVGFLGKPRLTQDIDAVVMLALKDIPEFLEAARVENITPRIKNIDEFVRKNRVFLMRHLPTEIDIDISLGTLPFEAEMVERSVTESTATFSIRLPTPEDLIIMKAVAHRPKDLEDIRTIVAKQTKLDRKRIQHWVQEFAEVLEMPGLWEQIEELLKT